jgi:two-component system sensor histidine kinase UhpB
MSLQRNLIMSVTLVLLLSLAAGAALTYEHAALKIRTEMKAALAVGRRVAQNAVEDSAQQADPARRLARIVGAFDGDRHLRAVFTDGAGRTVIHSTLQPPADLAPGIFFTLVAGPEMTAQVDLPPPLHGTGALRLLTDAHNEVSEAWSDVQLNLSILAIFFCLVLGLIVRTLRRAFRPLQELCDALTRIGAGDYSARLAWHNGQELTAVQNGFNAMAERLAGMELQNRLLQTRIQCVQEEERGELARDLHDEVAPFLFAVSADASLIRQHAASGNLGDVDGRAECILTSVNHMQRHLRHVLSRLMPDVLLDLGLSGAIETLAHFWKSRRPDIEIALHANADTLDDRRSAVAFRVVQESLSNAVRHANPTRIDIRIERTDDGCLVEITDDGAGMPAGAGPKGLGLLGMRERVSAVGGRLNIARGPGSRGTIVQALLHGSSGAMAVS